MSEIEQKIDLLKDSLGQRIVDIAEICSNEREKTLQKMIETASFGAIRAWEIDAKDVFSLGMCDVLERLQRNTLAMSNTLKIAQMIEENIKSELHLIISARNALAEEEKARKERISKSEKNAEKYSRKKANKVADEAE